MWGPLVVGYRRRIALNSFQCFRVAFTATTAPMPTRMPPMVSGLIVASRYGPPSSWLMMLAVNPASIAIIAASRPVNVPRMAAAVASCMFRFIFCFFLCGGVLLSPTLPCPGSFCLPGALFSGVFVATLCRPGWAGLLRRFKVSSRARVPLYIAPAVPLFPLLPNVARCCLVGACSRFPLPTTHYPLPTAHYPLPTTSRAVA